MRAFVLAAAVVFLCGWSFPLQSQEPLESYEQQAEEIVDDTEDDGSCVAEATFDAEWGLTTTSFDIPEVSFEMREMKFHFLKTDFNMKTISFDVPEFEWGTTNIGSIKLDLPKIYRKRVEIKTKIPEFTWDVTSIKTKIPEFSRRRIEWKYHILKIGKLQEASVPCKEKSERTSAAASSLQALSSEYQEAASDAALTEAGTAANELAASIGAWQDNLNQALRQIDDVIAEVQASGGDPNKVMANLDGGQVSLVQLRAAVVQRFQEEMEQAAEGHSELVREIEAFSMGAGQ